MRTGLPALLAALIALGAAPAAADYLAGWAALDAGDAAAARNAWLPDARAGDVDLQYDLGLLYESGLLGEVDRKAAADWYRAAAGRGLAAAQSRLARMQAQDDPDLAIDLLKKAAETGYAPAQYDLGLAYEAGQGVPLDPDLAIMWYRRAALQGLPQGQYALARAAMRHGGDLRQALLWYRAAAEAGLAEAQNNLGLLYEHGEGVARDLATAAQWYRLAADQGLAVAQYNLGLLLQYGLGIDHDPVAAAIYYKQAAYGGDPFGQVSYANALANGIGVEQDIIEAYAWILLARVGDDAEAEQIATEYARRLRPSLDATMRQAAIARATALREDVAEESGRRAATRPRPLPTEEIGADIVTAQRYLKLLGYNDGVVDGIAGPGTVTAVTRFQKDIGLEQDGRIDADLIALLIETAHKTITSTSEDVSDAGN